MDKLCRYFLYTNLELHSLYHLKSANERIISRLLKLHNKEESEYGKGIFEGNIQAYIDVNREIKNILRSRWD